MNTPTTPAALQRRAGTRPQGGRRRSRIGATSLCYGSALALALTLALSLLYPADAEAQATKTTRHTFVFGLADKNLRNYEGAEALRQRLHKRLTAARVHDFRMRIDRRYGELNVSVATDLPRATLLQLLTRRGDVELLPATKGVDTLAELSPTLPPTLELVYGRQGRDTDVHVVGPTRRGVQSWADQVALANHRLLVGPTGRGDVQSGYRTFLVERNSKPLGLNGLEAVQIHSGSYPNYYIVSAFWIEATSDDTGTLAGRSGLEAITRRVVPGTLLLSVDGRVLAAIRVLRTREEGQLTIHARGDTPHEQHHNARLLAAFLAGEVHPCDIVVVSSRHDR